MVVYVVVSGREYVGIAPTDYLMYSGYVHLAMHWLFMEAAASKALAGGPSAMKQDSQSVVWG